MHCASRGLWGVTCWLQTWCCASLAEMAASGLFFLWHAACLGVWWGKWNALCWLFTSSDLVLLVLEKGSSLCDQMYGFCYQLDFSNFFSFLEYHWQLMVNSKEKQEEVLSKEIPRGSCSGGPIFHCDGFFKPTEAQGVFTSQEEQWESFSLH